MSGARLNTTCETTVSIPDDSDEQQEVIEVQILPQVNQTATICHFCASSIGKVSAIKFNVSQTIKSYQSRAKQLVLSSHKPTTKNTRIATVIV